MDDTQTLAETFKALSDPTRLRLVRLLGNEGRGGKSDGGCGGHGGMCVNSLAHRLGVTQPAVSQHLRVLRHSGLVSGTRKGRFVHYSLDPTGLAHLREALERIHDESDTCE